MESEQLNKTTAELLDAFHTYMTDGKPESFQRLRSAFMKGTDYRPYKRRLERVVEQIEQRADDSILQDLNKLKSGYLISPDFHLALAHVLNRLGQTDESSVECLIAQRCIDGILSTGDGTEKRPYFVTFVSDEYNVMSLLQKQLQMQCLVKRGDREFDMLRCQDGSELCFDITEMRAVDLRERLGTTERKTGGPVAKLFKNL